MRDPACAGDVESLGRAGSMTRPQLCVVKQKRATAAACVEAALPKRVVRGCKLRAGEFEGLAG